ALPHGHGRPLPRTIERPARSKSSIGTRVNPRKTVASVPLGGLQAGAIGGAYDNRSRNYRGWACHGANVLVTTPSNWARGRHARSRRGRRTDACPSRFAGQEPGGTDTVRNRPDVVDQCVFEADRVPKRTKSFRRRPEGLLSWTRA